MQKAKPTYDEFFMEVPLAQRPYVQQVHEALLASGCTLRIEPSKSGYVVSYDHPASGRVLANFIFRKKGVIIRIYADNVGKYDALLSTFPDDLKKSIAKAGVCRRMLDPTKCNARCPMGNVFTLDGQEHKKCRYNNFLILLDETTTPYIQSFLQKELEARTA